ncbi:MAG TPA: hypothetical protein DCQ64_29620 [Candidatus Rokubacteria bacterium]|nr:hypothetical protein [Candidatus Rokubacteria bacterium]
MKPPCRDCNGYGSADGAPCGTLDRDFGPDAPGPCTRCKGTGDDPDPTGELAVARRQEIAHRDGLAP